jgi:hypothetical protein
MPELQLKYRMWSYDLFKSYNLNEERTVRKKLKYEIQYEENKK